MNSDTAEKGAKSATYNLGMTNKEMPDSFIGTVNLYNKTADALKWGITKASSIEITKS